MADDSIREVEKVHNVVHLLIGNIPKELHSSDLRVFFSQFVEKGAFTCFHYRHRPETFQGSSTSQTVSSNDVREVNEAKDDTVSDVQEVKTSADTCCCFVEVKSEHVEEFMQKYHGKHWSLPNEQPLLRTVKITKIRLPQARVVNAPSSSLDNTHGATYSTDLAGKSSSLLELSPPSVMPCGNVGTPTKVFIELINACKLPTKVIKKLKLEFPKSRAKRRYGAVGHDYDQTADSQEEGHEEDREKVETVDQEDEVVCGDELPSSSTRKRLDPPSDGENDAEEWERYESYHFDVDKQERTKPRLFENEMEVVWEKGGSGLVFYTDSNFWKEQDEDSDEPDEWDLDLECYYNPFGGDKDSRDLIDIDRERRLRRGEDVPDPREIGGFERHTKGFGGRMLKQSGWEEGSGLGRDQKGIAEPLESEGQIPTNKRGIGYYGEKLARDPEVLFAKRSKRGQREVMISTIYDSKQEKGEESTILRTAPVLEFKYRDKVPFKKGPTLYYSTDQPPP